MCKMATGEKHKQKLYAFGIRSNATKDNQGWRSRQRKEQEKARTMERWNELPTDHLDHLEHLERLQSFLMIDDLSVISMVDNLAHQL